MVDRLDGFAVLVGEKLSAVVFVLNYLQLQFDGPMITALTPVTVAADGAAATLGDVSFANLLVAQIGKVVERVEHEPDRHIQVVFVDRSVIRMSLRGEDYVGPEAVLINSAAGLLVV